MFLHSADSAKEGWKTIIIVPDITDSRSFNLLISFLSWKKPMVLLAMAKCPFSNSRIQGMPFSLQLNGLWNKNRSKCKSLLARSEVSNNPSLKQINWPCTIMPQESNWFLTVATMFCFCRLLCKNRLSVCNLEDMQKWSWDPLSCGKWMVWSQWRWKCEICCWDPT